MISKSWRNGFVRVCAISAAAWGVAVAQTGPVPAGAPADQGAASAQAAQPSAAQAPQNPATAQTGPVPAIALVDGSDAVQWQTLTRDLGWRVIAAGAAANGNIDERVIALRAAVQAA